MDNRDNIDAVQRMQSFIQAHLEQPITLHMRVQVTAMVDKTALAGNP